MQKGYSEMADKPKPSVCALTGSTSEDFTTVLVKQAVQSVPFRGNDEQPLDQPIKAVFASLQGINPKDEIEGMLAAQMVAVHNATMDCFRRAMVKDQTFAGREMNLNQATKLSRTYAMQIEALNRYRGKGQQKVTVEHVHVHAGGQAIVGHVSRSEGGGITEKTEEQPHAKQITHAPGQTLPRQSTKRKTVPVARDA